MVEKDYSLDELVSQFGDGYREAETELGQCNVLAIGKTGVGKSTLINAVFREKLAETGVGRPITQGIRQYTKSPCPIAVYDTPGLELSDEQIERMTLEVSELIDSRRLLDPKEHIHVIWYCINYESRRFEHKEENWLKLLELKDIPVILVVTQTTTQKRSEFIQTLEAMNLPVTQVVPVLAEAKEVHDDFPAVQPHGLDRLVEITFDLLPECAREAFIREQIASVNLKAKGAFKYLSGYVASSAVVGASPIPFSDAPLLMGVQTVMLGHITAIFGLPFDRGFIATLLTAIAGTTGATAIGRSIVGNLVKFLPGAGTLVGGAISASTAASLTLALGLAYIELLKVYMKAQWRGETLSKKELSRIFVYLYKDYLQSGRKTPSEEPILPPREIDIQD